jgi:hypothetical protein
MGTNRTSDFAVSSVSAKRCTFTSACSASRFRANLHGQRTSGLSVSGIKVCSSLKPYFALPQKRVATRSSRMEVHPIDRPAAYLSKKPAMSHGRWEHYLRSKLTVKFSKTVSRLIDLPKLNVKKWRELSQRCFVCSCQMKKWLIGNNGGHHGFRVVGRGGKSDQVAKSLRESIGRFRFAYSYSAPHFPTAAMSMTIYTAV